MKSSPWINQFPVFSSEKTLSEIITWCAPLSENTDFKLVSASWKLAELNDFIDFWGKGPLRKVIQNFGAHVSERWTSC